VKNVSYDYDEMYEGKDADDVNVRVTDELSQQFSGVESVHVHDPPHP
jgi:hypothetical protein